MEPTHNSFGPPQELPQPQEVGNTSVPNQQPAASPEVRGLTPPQTPISSPPAIPASDTAQPTQATPPPISPTHNAAIAATTQIADDADLIEKEWVTRAKAIVMHTKDDPHAQNDEMNKVKADYLKKRYNKDLKISEG